MMPSAPEALFLDAFFKRFRNYKELGDKTIAQLNEAQLHWQPNETSNSVAVIIQHLTGNLVSRWTDFLTTDGEKPERNRDAEFEAQPLSKSELQTRWNAGWQVALDALLALQPADLFKTVSIRGEAHTVPDAINRQLGHAAYHVGQLVFLAKWLLNENWQTLSIPKGGSPAFNESMKQSNPKP